MGKGRQMVHLLASTQEVVLEEVVLKVGEGTQMVYPCASTQEVVAVQVEEVVLQVGEGRHRAHPSALMYKGEVEEAVLDVGEGPPVRCDSSIVFLASCSRQDPALDPALFLAHLLIQMLPVLLI